MTLHVRELELDWLTPFKCRVVLQTVLTVGTVAAWWCA